MKRNVNSISLVHKNMNFHRNPRYYNKELFVLIRLSKYVNLYPYLCEFDSIGKWQHRNRYDLMTNVKHNRDECPYSMNACNIDIAGSFTE